MKILIIHQGYEMYGSDRMLLNCLESIRSVFPTSDIEIALPKEGLLSKEIEKRSIVNKLTFKRIGVIRKSDVKKLDFKIFYHITFGLIKRYKELKKVDLVYVNSIVILDFLILSCFVKNRMIIHIHEIPDGLFGAIFKLLIRSSKAHLVAVSSEVKRYFNVAKINVIPNGIDGYYFSEKHISDRINLLIIGRLNHQKGQLFFLKAFAKLDSQSRAKFKIKIVGDVFENQVHFKNEILEFIERNSLKQTVQLFSFSEEPDIYFQWAHIVVLPSTKPESFGLVAVEGMSAGCAVLGAYLGGLKDIVDDSNGWFFKPNDEQDLIAKLELISRSQDNIIQFGRNGRLKFEQNYSKKSFFHSHGQLIMNILK